LARYRSGLANPHLQGFIGFSFGIFGCRLTGQLSRVLVLL
jgi:hypothetical protein